MIECPACKKQLPDWAQACQFCGADTKKVSRPIPVAKTRTSQAGYIAPWIWSAYYAISVYFILSGAGTIFTTIQASHDKFFGEEMGLNFFSYIAMAIGAATILTGLGLILKIELARGVANFVCGMAVIFGLFKLSGALLGMMFSSFLGLLLVVKLIVDIGTNALMIYIIGETDRGMPSRGSPV